MKNNIITDNVSISTIIKEYLNHRFKIFYVVDYESRLIGTITQGDLLRALSEADLNLKTYDIMQHNFIKIKSKNEIDKDLIDFLSENRIDELPIIDDNGKVIEIYSIYNHLKSLL